MDCTWCSMACVVGPEDRVGGYREAPCRASMGLGWKPELWISSRSDYNQRSKVRVCHTVGPLKNLRLFFIHPFIDHPIHIQFNLHILHPSMIPLSIIQLYIPHHPSSVICPSIHPSTFNSSLHHPPYPSPALPVVGTLCCGAWRSWTAGVRVGAPILASLLGQAGGIWEGDDPPGMGLVGGGGPGGPCGGPGTLTFWYHDQWLGTGGLFGCWANFSTWRSALDYSTVIQNTHWVTTVVIQNTQWTN